MAKAMVIRFETSEKKGQTMIGELTNRLKEITGIKETENLVNRFITVKRRKTDNGFLHRVVIAGPMHKGEVQSIASTLFAHGLSTPLSMEIKHDL